MNNTHSNPIAIIGMACRFPGAENNDAYWDLLKNGLSPRREIPPDRWNFNDYYSAEENQMGKMYVKQGYFLDDIDQFDPQFFRISPKEAASMDPQQRILLEVSQSALNDSRLTSDQLFNSSTGVFVAMMNNDYGSLITRNTACEEINFLSGLGNSNHCAAGRIAYTFGLKGPCATIDTACSSSLVAIHQACLSLRAHDCNMALVAAVNLILDPYLMISMCNGKVLAKDGRCKSFDASADGYARGEGCGVVILKRLSDAIHDNDNILGVIRGSAINQNGAGSGLTVPNGESQRALLMKAMQNANVGFDDISYIEAHGSATQLGDLIEVNSITSVLKGKRTPENPLYLGSVKTNIGHLEAASGMAGLIKVILSLKHEMLPQHLHLNQLNPHLDLASIPAIIPQKNMAWKKSKGKRIAGISAFGISGTNAHIIVEESPNEVNYQPFNPVRFKRKRYWLKQWSEQKPAAKNINSFNQINQLRELVFETKVDLNVHHYIKDHRVDGVCLFPAAKHIEIAYSVGKTLSHFIGKSSSEYAILLKQFMIENPLQLNQTDEIVLTVKAQYLSDAHYKLSIEHNSQRFIVCDLVIQAAQIHSGVNFQKKLNQLTKVHSVDHLYKKIDEIGLQYGALMRPLVNLWADGSESIGELRLPSEVKEEASYHYPILIDGALQAVGLNVLKNEIEAGSPQFYLPIGFNEVIFHQPVSGHVYAHGHYHVVNTVDGVIEADIFLYDESHHLAIELRGLCLKRKNNTERVKLIADNQHPFMYVEDWIPKAFNEVKSLQQQHWLIMGNPDHLGELLVRELQAAGHVAELDAAALVCQPAYLERFTGIMYLASLATSEMNEDYQHIGAGLLPLLQALAKTSHAPHLLMVTRGAKHVNDDDKTHPYQAIGWGMLQAARHEFPDNRIKSLDIDPQQKNTSLVIKQLMHEMQDNQDLQVALRGEQRFVLQLHPYKNQHQINSAINLSLSGTYIITGGLGGLGLSVAEWLIQQGVKYIVLLGRKRPDNAIIQWIDKWNEKGIYISTFMVDVSDRDNLQSVLHSIRNNPVDFAPLKGVIHAAGVLSDGLLVNQTWDNYLRVFNAKIRGAWNLHQLTLQDNLEHFILFSSIASVMGGVGQSNYAAANAFLDALSHYRREQGLVSLSINWGPWAKVGMASDYQDLHVKNGFMPLEPSLGVTLFGESLLVKSVAQLLIADIQWQRFLAKIPAHCLNQFVQHTDHRTVLSDIKSAAVNVKHDMPIHHAVMTVLRETLEFDEDKWFQGDENFFDLGMDSLFALQFIDKLKPLLGDHLEVSIGSVFKHPTINALSKYIESQSPIGRSHACNQ